MLRLVSLTFDDGLDVHLDRARPLLERYGFTGTFYLNPGAPSFARRAGEWRRAAAAGHELGNHTMRHPAARGKPDVTDANAIEDYTLERMRRELDEANAVLSALDGERVRTFAYPCCNPVLGRPGLVKRALCGAGLDRTRLMGMVLRHPWLDAGSTQRSYESLAADLFPAARTGGERFSAGADFPPPRTAVPGIALDGKGGTELARVLDAFMRHERGWLVFLAHGIGGGHRLSCDESVFEELLDSLRARGVEVRTMRDAARAVYSP